MNSTIEYLKGKKTYIVGVAAAITVGAQVAGLISPDTANTLLSMLGVGGLITLRAAISKGA